MLSVTKPKSVGDQFQKFTHTCSSTLLIFITAIVVFSLTVWGILALGFRPVADQMPVSIVHPDHFPAKGFSSDFTFDYIQGVLNQDVVPRNNLASFTTTWMEPEAKALIMDGMVKNFADKHEYAGTEQIHQRCVSMMAELFHAPGVGDNSEFGHKSLDGVGTATVGSSEAFMLAGLAMKFYWREARKAKGLPYDKPNIVMPSTVHLSLKQFAKFFDVELRLAGVRGEKYVAEPQDIISLVDENTIGVVSILGSTYNGQFEDVEGLNDALEKLNKENGWDVGIHIDGASGAFVAPFLFPDLKWDFLLSTVRSINVSGHKYGLVFAGVGWLVFRESKYLPSSLYQRYNYLGGGEKASFSINFSKPSHQVIAQYYNLLRLGNEGYSKIMHSMKHQSEKVGEDLVKLGFKLNVPEEKLRLPVTAFSLGDRPRKFDEFDLASKLSEKGWMVPAYTMVKRLDSDKKQNLMRIVSRNDFDDTHRSNLMTAITESLKELDTGSRAK